MAATEGLDWSLWADLAADGGLASEERAMLERRMAADPELAAEHGVLAGLRRLLEADRVEVDPAFAAQVMEELPPAPWEASPARAWLLPAAAVVLLGLGASLLLAGAGLGDGPIFGTGFALFDFLQTAALAGAGLIAATWRGAGLGLDHLFAESGVNLAVLAAGVLMLNLLFFRMLRRGKRGQPALADSGQAGSSEG